MEDDSWGDRELPTVFVSDDDLPEGALRITFEPTDGDVYFDYIHIRVFIRKSRYEGGFEVYMAHTLWGPADHSPLDLVRSRQSLIREFGEGIADVIDEMMQPTTP